MEAIVSAESQQLTDNVNVAELGFGRHRVYLAHVAALVFFLYVPNV